MFFVGIFFFDDKSIFNLPTNYVTRASVQALALPHGLGNRLNAAFCYKSSIACPNSVFLQVAFCEGIYYALLCGALVKSPSSGKQEVYACSSSSFPLLFFFTPGKRGPAAAQENTPPLPSNAELFV